MTSKNYIVKEWIEFEQGLIRLSDILRFKKRFNISYEIRYAIECIYNRSVNEKICFTYETFNTLEELSNRWKQLITILDAYDYKAFTEPA